MLVMKSGMPLEKEQNFLINLKESPKKKIGKLKKIPSKMNFDPVLQ